MSPGDQPEELKGLTFMEQTLISPIKPFLTVFRLKGGQYGFNGDVISFEQNLSILVKQLPDSLTSLSGFVIIRRSSDDLSSFREFRVIKSKSERCAAMFN